MTTPGPPEATQATSSTSGTRGPQQQGTQKATLWNPFGGSSGAPNPPSSDHDGKLSYYASAAPKISTPTGGGALKSVDEKFNVNPVTGSSSITIPFAVSPGRNELTPTLSLAYDSGSGNGPFGLGWTLALPTIRRKTAKGLPQYDDVSESDVFIMSGLEDLVPKLESPGEFVDSSRGDWTIHQYWPRTEGAFTRIERWSRQGHPEDTYWRTISGTNITTFFGRTPESKVMDFDSGRVFSWMVSEVYDSMGNAIKYSYKAEDSTGVPRDRASEWHRNEASRAANRYLKSVKYGNLRPNRDGDWMLREVPDDDWMFEVVLDYGDHDSDAPGPQPTRPWPTRVDPFSGYTAGFEVRAYRLCRRLLLFHHLEQELGTKDYLVKSLELTYDESPMATVLTSAVHLGHAVDVSGARSKRSLPPLEFNYSAVNLATAQTNLVESPALSNLPSGLSTPLQWIDLDGIGKSSPIFMGQSGWYQMRNLSTCEADYHNPLAGVVNVEFGPAMPLADMPNVGRDGSTAVLDLDGNGRLDVVQKELGRHGFYERSDEGGWTEFRTFSSWPNVDTNNSNLRYLDVTGNGLADIIISEADSFLWYPSLGTEGYGEAIRTFTKPEEEEGARLLFSDGMEIIYLADFSGDGLADLVRIRNGDVCYWPNIGYGRFGAKITMDNAPILDPWYIQSRVQLADIDGSGTADMLYFPPDGGLRVYLNQAGNGWSPASEIGFPLMDNLSSVSMVDLFGTSTSSVVWSTSAPGPQGRLQYLDFTHGLKPYLMTGYRNGSIEAKMDYKSSVAFHQADELARRPWPTRLPNPMQCLSRVRTYDYLSRSFSEKSYTYHDGYFDGVEREFRGFGKVELISEERFLLGKSSPTFPRVPELKGLSTLPTLHVSWYDTGAYECLSKTRALYQSEFYGQSSPSGLSDISVSLRETPVSAGTGDVLSEVERRQACRAVKGTLMHEEAYLLDGTDKQHIPLTFTDSLPSVRMLQPTEGARPGVFLVSASETLTCQLERDEKDPRITHEITLEVDDFGNVTKSVSIAYGRQRSARTAAHTADDWQAQGATIVLYAEQDFTNAVSSPDEFLTPHPAASRQFEIKGLLPRSRLFVSDDVSSTRIQALVAKKYTDDGDTPGRRLMAHSQSRYKANDMSRILDAGVLESLALTGKSYTLAMMPDVIQSAFPSSGPGPQELLTDTSFLTGTGESDGGYVDLNSDGSWWIPSEQQYFSHDAGATPQQELEAARALFFKPISFEDPFGQRNDISWDECVMFPVKVTDAVGNTVAAAVDYRVLQPYLVTDENDNQTAAAFDALGQRVGTAVMGKPGKPLGDTVDGFQPFLDDDTIRRLAADPLRHAVSVLNKCSSVSFSQPATYSTDLGWSPSFSIAVARDASLAVMPAGSGSDGNERLQIAISYYDGRGQALQTRTLASIEPGPDQWVVGGCTVTNSGGASMRQFDSFYDDSPSFSHPPPSVVYSTNFYDPAGRVVVNLLPNHTWAKNIYGSWTQAAYDPGDNILTGNPLEDPDIGRYVACLDDATSFSGDWHSTRANSSDPSQRRAAELSSTYAGTPTIVWLDSQGRSFAAVTDNGEEGKHTARSYKDVQGRTVKMVDREDRLVSLCHYDLAGACVHSTNMDTGDAWLLNDVTGKVIRSWNSRSVRQSTSYDRMRRPVSSRIREAGGPEFTALTYAYGDTQPNAEARNLRSKLFELRDQAVVTTTDAFDHLGNALEGRQRLLKEYKAAVDWSADVELEDDIFTWSATYDSLGRQLSNTRTDGSTVSYTWTQRGQLASVRVAGSPGLSGSVIKAVQYNSRGQRLHVSYGNGAESYLEYDPLTFAMTSKKTVSSRATVQDLRYTLDCTGRIVQTDDLAQQDIFFRGQVVKPTKQYTYDATGRLVRATGREHLGQIGDHWVSVPSSASAGSRELSPSDGKAMANYTEEYFYSPEGNMLSLKHAVADKGVTGWTRTYQYSEPSRLERDKYNNRLSSSTVGGAVSTCKYEGNAGEAGLMTSMTGFSLLQYDAYNQLSASSRQVVKDGTPETTWYRYNAQNQRIRKVTERFAAAGEEPIRTKDHIYANGGDLELFRQFDPSGSAARSERWSWHVHADGARVALVEGDKDPLTGRFDADADKVISRYMVSDHLSSCSVETDEEGNVISMEEFSPYGATTYSAAAASLQVDKRFRFAAKERDVETGMDYFDHRYLLAWLGRWLSPDPTGTKDGLNVYCFVGCDPINRADPSGLQGEFAFVLLNSHQHTVLNQYYQPFTYINGDTAQATDPIFLAAFYELWAFAAHEFNTADPEKTRFSGAGRVDMIAMHGEGGMKVDASTNTPGGFGYQKLHAEDKWFLWEGSEVEDSITMPLTNAFLTRMPCSSMPTGTPEYAGFECFPYFSSGGKSVTRSVETEQGWVGHNQTLRFEPSRDVTTVFHMLSGGNAAKALSDMKGAGPAALYGFFMSFWGHERQQALDNGIPAADVIARIGAIPAYMFQHGSMVYPLYSPAGAQLAARLDQELLDAMQALEYEELTEEIQRAYQGP